MKDHSAIGDITNNALTIVDGAVVEGYSVTFKRPDDGEYILAFKDRSNGLYYVRKFFAGKEGTQNVYTGHDSYICSFEFVFLCQNPEEAIKSVIQSVKNQNQSSPTTRVHTHRRRQVK